MEIQIIRIQVQEHIKLVLQLNMKTNQQSKEVSKLKLLNKLFSGKTQKLHIYMKKQKSVFVICSVRDADKATRKKLEAYKNKLELQGYKVHLPHLDTNQQASGYEICIQNMQAILAADEIHIFFVPHSYGSHFDLGVTFLACYLDKNKIIKVVENFQGVDHTGQMKLLFEKSFGQMIAIWEENQK